MSTSFLVLWRDAAIIVKTCNDVNNTLAIATQEPLLNRISQGKPIYIADAHPTEIELALRCSLLRNVCEIAAAGDYDKHPGRFVLISSINLDLVALCSPIHIDCHGLRIDSTSCHIAPLSYGSESACSTIDAFEPRWTQLVLEFTGRKLQCFSSSKELCSAVCDALEGYSELHSQTKALHGDINSNNILITKEGKGSLLDGDLCKAVDSVQTAARRDWRSGTWSFMSRASLEKLDKPHELSDDLEAFFHVLLYHGLRYRTASKKLRYLQRHMQEIFDGSFQDEEGYFHGGVGKFHFFRMNFFDAEDIAAILPTPLAGLIEELRDLFNVFYWPKTRRAGPSPEEARERLRSSTYFLTLFKAHLNLDGWLHDDPAVDVLPQLLRRNKRTWRM